MQKITTKIFIIASIIFGLLGITLIVTTPAGLGDFSTPLNTFLMKGIQVCVFIILPSFALSVAGKYLNGKS